MLIQPLPDLSAQEVRMFRRMLALDQEQFAALLGVSTSSVEKWERKGTQGRYRYTFAAINAGLKPWSHPASDHSNDPGRHAVISGTR